MSKPDLRLASAGWRTSSLTGGNSDNCVEVAPIEDMVAVRDSKDRQGPALFVPRDGWHAFLAAARRGQLHH